jgi:hypothetical protein
MTSSQPDTPAEPDPRDVAACKMDDRSLSKGLISPAEYFWKITLTVAQTSEDLLGPCLDTLRPQLVGQYAAYLRELLIPTDFMPYTGAFQVLWTEDEAERLRRALRPRYIALYNEVLAREERLLRHPEPQK